MTKDKNKLDELFRSKLADFEQEPPSYVWSRIQDLQMGQKRRNTFLFLKVAGVAAAVLLAFLLGWQLQQSQKEMLPEYTEQQIETKKDGTPLDQITDSGNVQDTGDQAVEKGETEKGLANASAIKKKTDDSSHRSNKREEVTSETILANDHDASNSHVQLTDAGRENRKQKTEQLQMLRLLNIRLDERFNNKQLAQRTESSKESDSRLGDRKLSNQELTLIDENAKLLAANRMDKKSGSWQVGAMLTPTYQVNQSSQSSEYAINMAVPGSTEDLQLGGGILIEYKTRKRWSIQSGIYYSKMDQSSSNQTFSSANAISDQTGKNLTPEEAAYFSTAVSVRSGDLHLNTSAGVVAIEELPSNARLSNGLESLAGEEGTLLNQTQFEQDFEYIEIPLILRYQIIEGAFDLQLLGGFNTSVLVANNAYAKDQTGRQRIGETQDMNSLNYGTSIGFGVGYGITDRIRIRAEPQFKYFLGSLNSNANVNFKPYTIGVYTGLSYRF